MDIRVSVRVALSAKDTAALDPDAIDDVGILRIFEAQEISGFSVSLSHGDSQVCVPVDQVALGDRSRLEFLLSIPSSGSGIYTTICPEPGAESCSREHGFATVSLIAVHKMDYIQFIEAISLSKEIVNMKLQLNMCLRDVFCDGMVAHLNKSEQLNVENIGSFIASASASALKTLDNGNVLENSVVIDEAPSRKASGSVTKAQRRSLSEAKSKSSKSTVPTPRLNYGSSLTCVYCDKPGSIENLELQVHPYVPVTMDRKVLYLCVSCHFNWLSYRQEASRLKLLVLAGEYSEEVCAICSDSPPELVLCSACPRSYCNPCLLKLLTPKQSMDMATNEQWRCLCCVHSETDFCRYTSSLNLTISSQTSSLSLDKKAASTTVTQRNVKSNISTDAVVVKKEKRQLASTITNSVKPERSAADSLVGDSVSELPVLDKISKRSRPSLKKLESESQSMRKSRSPPVKKKKVSTKVRTKDLKIIDSSSSSRVIANSKKKIKDNLPPVTSEFDELYYFSQYINMRRVNQVSLEKEDESSESEDFCFLCKDGGNVIECDYGHNGKGLSTCGSGCKKVYHEYCLGYKVPNDTSDWICMRHFCVMCGSKDIIYQCEYCPFSSCKNCFLDWNVENKMSQFAQKIVPPPTAAVKRRKKKKGPRLKKSSHVINITCGACLRMFDKSYERKLLVKEKCNLGILRNVSELNLPLPRLLEDPNECLESTLTIQNEDGHNSVDPPPIKCIVSPDGPLIDLTEVSTDTDVE